MANKEIEKKYKIITVGDATTGKSSILMRYIDGKFLEEIPSTIGVDFKYKDLKIQALDESTDFAQLATEYGFPSTDKEKIRKALSKKKQEAFDKLFETSDIYFQLWDTAGQEIYRSVTRAYYKSSNAAVIVFDLTNRKSFESVQDWLHEITSVLKNDVYSKSKNKTGMVRIYLVGNKKDLTDQIVVKQEEIDSLASKVLLGEDVPEKEEKITNYFAVSAKSGEGVKELFEHISRNIVLDHAFKFEDEENKESVITDLPKNKNDGGFCGCGGNNDEDENSTNESSDEEESPIEKENSESN